MVCLEKIQAGASAFLDAEIMPKLPGLQRWLFGGTAALFLERLPDMVRNISESNFFRTRTQRRVAFADNIIHC